MTQPTEAPDLIIAVVGTRPVEFVDDIGTGRAHQLEPGEPSAVLASEGGEGPFIPPALPIYIPPDVTISVDQASTLGEDVPAALRAGQTVRVALHRTPRLALSEIAPLADAAHSEPGNLIIEIDG